MESDAARCARDARDPHVSRARRKTQETGTEHSRFDPLTGLILAEFNAADLALAAVQAIDNVRRVLGDLMADTSSKEAR